MQQDIQMKTNEIQREGRKKDKLERELRQAKSDLDSKVIEIKNLQQTLDYTNANVAKLNGDLKDQKVRRSDSDLFLFLVPRPQSVSQRSFAVSGPWIAKQPKGLIIAPDPTQLNWTATWVELSWVGLGAMIRPLDWPKEDV